MAPLKMLGCAVAIGGIAAGLQVTRVRRPARPGLCPPGALPARGLHARGLPARPGRASTPPRARGQGHSGPQQPSPQQPSPQQPLRCRAPAWVLTCTALRAQAPSSTPSSTTSSSPRRRRGCTLPRRSWPLDARAAPSVCVTTSTPRHAMCHVRASLGDSWIGARAKA